MRYLVSLLLAMILFGSAVATTARAEEPAAGGKIRILLTFGGHDFEQPAFFAMFDAMPDVQYTKAPLPESAGLLKPGLEKDYDAIVMYDMVAGIKPEQQKAMVDLLNIGIGLVSLHHNMGAHRDWEEFTKIIGGKFIFTPCELEGKKYTQSGWIHDQDMHVTVVDREHPITKGVGDFDIHDEAYNEYYTASNVKVLLETDHPKNDPKLAWVKHYGRSRVFYLMLGHDGKAYANPNYSRLVRQGIRWAARR